MLSAILSVTPSCGEVVTLDYNDLLNRIDLSDEIEKAFGKDGLGILIVKNTPDFIEARQRLLPLARTFARLDDSVKEKYVDADSFYSFGWSHGKERLQGKPDSSKGSFYANPLVDVVTDDAEVMAEHPGFAHPNIWPHDDLPELEPAFKSLGRLIVDVGVLVAHQCDKFASKYKPTYNDNRLETVLKTSVCAKARLLHYFSRSEEDIRNSNVITAADPDGEDDLFSNWCGWHNDHGSLTGLTSAMFFNEVTGEQVENTDKDAGLYIRNRKGEIVKVSIPPDSIAFQIGECAQIHSGGALQATPHAVRGSNMPGISRETFAVFMEPMWDEPMAMPEGVSPEEAQSQSASKTLPKGVPPLSSRWEESMTFGEFTKSTLKAYY